MNKKNKIVKKRSPMVNEEGVWHVDAAKYVTAGDKLPLNVGEKFPL